MEKVSMKDVAKHAGVSIATVSHVINKSRKVSKENERRVLQSIRELNYHPNSVARSFKTGRSNLIAFVVPDIADLYCSTLIENIESEIGQEGYQLLLVSSGENPEKELAQLEFLENSMVDGIILASTQRSLSSLEGIISGRIPYLIIDRRLDPMPYDSATINTYDAVREAVEHLVAAGHKKIGCITGMPHLSSSKERVSAYRTVLERHGLFAEELIQNAEVRRLSTSTDPVSLVRKGCSAIVMMNNSLTIDTFFRLAKAGLVPGRDVALTGFKEGNATQYELEFIDRIEQPVAQLGRVAGRQILNRLKNPELPAKDIILEAVFRPLPSPAPVPVMPPQ